MPGVEYKRKKIVVEKERTQRQVSAIGQSAIELLDMLSDCKEPECVEGLPKGHYWKSTKGLIAVDALDIDTKISNMGLRLKLLRKALR